MTPAEFKVLFEEFAGASDATVQARLTWAEDRTPLAIWGDNRDQGVAWMAAHMLCMLPGSEDMRKGEKPGESMYGRERARLNKIHASGFRTAGT